MEGLLSARIDPRTRIFIAQFFTKMTGLTIYDLYTHVTSSPSFSQK
jgi:hypothetical protein